MPSRPASSPRHRRSNAHTRSSPIGPMLVAGGVIVLVIMAGILAVSGATVFTAPPEPEAMRAVLSPSATDGCRAPPAFLADPALGFGDQANGTSLATDQTQVGLVLMVPGAQTPAQHATWDDAGYLGPIAYDGTGAIYATPVPRVSLQDNPPAGATTIWRVDPTTAVMQPFVVLPGTANERNPYGVVGLTFSCDLDLLVASAVTGSTPTTEHGAVALITRNGTLRSTPIENLDTLGVLVVRHGDGYVLYAGLARAPVVVAVPLDANGLPLGPPRDLIDLTLAGATPSERARKLRLVGDRLIVDLVPFNFSLQTGADGQRPLRQVQWGFDEERQIWVPDARLTTITG